MFQCAYKNIPPLSPYKTNIDVSKLQSDRAVCSPIQESQDPGQRSEGLLPRWLGGAKAAAGAESDGALEPRVGGEGGEAVSRLPLKTNVVQTSTAWQTACFFIIFDVEETWWRPRGSQVRGSWSFSLQPWVLHPVETKNMMTINFRSDILCFMVY